MTCIHRGGIHRTRTTQDGNTHPVFDCGKFTICTEQNEGLTLLGTTTPIGVCKGCQFNQPRGASPGSAFSAISAPPRETSSSGSRFCYFTATNRASTIPMIESLIRSARAAGVTEDIHAFTPGCVDGAINHVWPADRPWKHMQKIEILRDHMATLDYDYFVWLDSDTWFTRKPDLRPLLRSNPIWVQMESEMTSPKNMWQEWWGAAFPDLFAYFRSKGVTTEKMWNTNGGMFIVRREAIGEFSRQAFEIYDDCRARWPTTEDETPLALLGHLMVENPALNTNEATCWTWTCDWHGHYLHKIPDGQPWPSKDWMTGESRICNAAIVHAMRSKEAMTRLSQSLQISNPQVGDKRLKQVSRVASAPGLPRLQPRIRGLTPPGSPLLSEISNLQISNLEPVPPSLLIRGWNFATAIARWTAAGRPMRSKPEIEARLAVCQACPELTPDSVCRRCGCQCQETERVMNKLALATEKCPLGKWQ